MGGLTSRTPHATPTPRRTDRGGGKRLISKDKSRLGKREKGCSEPAESESGAEAGASGHERAREKERERVRDVGPGAYTMKWRYLQRCKDCATRSGKRVDLPPLR